MWRNFEKSGMNYVNHEQRRDKRITSQQNLELKTQTKIIHQTIATWNT